MMKYVALNALVLVLFVGLAACERQEGKREGGIKEKKEAVRVTDDNRLPEGHPQVSGDLGVLSGKDIGGIENMAASHPRNGEVQREVRIPDEVKAKWKTVNLMLRDKAEKREEVMAVDIGKKVAIKDGNFAIRVEAFMPHYTMYDTYISSKSNEPVNPAVLVELFEGDKSLAKGWVFTNFSAFNSYKHERYDILLPPISSPR